MAKPLTHIKRLNKELDSFVNDNHVDDPAVFSSHAAVISAVELLKTSILQTRHETKSKGANDG